MKCFKRKKEKKQVFNFDEEKQTRYQLILDMDNTLIIRKNKIIEPKLKPTRTFSGELLYHLWPPDEDDCGLAFLSEKDFKKLRNDLYNLIKERIKLAKIKSKNT